MKIQSTIIASLISLSLLFASGCAVTRGQESVGAYIDDTAITSSVKAQFVGNTDVDASSISVETLKGAVVLSGFAKNMKEKATAETIARKVNGVSSVRNDIIVRP